MSGSPERVPYGRRGHRVRADALGLALALAVAAGWSLGIEAHKPITSPFTFSEDVLPIVKAQCGACHAPGGVAPMSLLTHTDAVPWAESIRVELMAGHMPPWGIQSATGRFRNLQAFSAREMNVLLTWASGGTPPGKPDTSGAAALPQQQWPLGEPDLTIPLRQAAIADNAQILDEEFRIPVPARPLRAVDLLPGTPAIVRRATISVRAVVDARGAGIPPERLIALWVPGDHPVALDAGIGFQVPPTAELIVRIQYRKTWQYERKAMTDQSRIGLYFADPGSAEVQVLRAFTPAASEATIRLKPDPTVFVTTVSEDVRALALYADPDLSGANTTVIAVRPDGSREELISFRPQADWARRYWFREPILLPRGTRIQVTADLGDDRLLPPAAASTPQPGARASLSLALNVLAAH
jgi:hypothetical protein